MQNEVNTMVGDMIYGAEWSIFIGFAVIGRGAGWESRLYNTLNPLHSLT